MEIAWETLKGLEVGKNMEKLLQKKSLKDISEFQEADFAQFRPAPAKKDITLVMNELQKVDSTFEKRN